MCSDLIAITQMHPWVNNYPAISLSTTQFDILSKENKAQALNA